MFVSVSYFDESTNAFKVGRAYTYKTSLILEPGQVVYAPVKNRGTGVVEDKRAMVVAVNLPEPPFPCNEITKIYDKGV